jgi:hypothetical protein
MLSGKYLLQAGFRLAATDFGLPEKLISTEEQLSAINKELEQDFITADKASAALQSFLNALRDRVGCVVEMLKSKTVVVENSQELFTEAQQLILLLQQLGGYLPAFTEGDRLFLAFRTLLQNRSKPCDLDRVDKEISSVASMLLHFGGQWKISSDHKLAKEHPLPHVGQEDFSTSDDWQSGQWENCEQVIQASLFRLFALQYRALGRLLVIVTVVENHIEAKTPWR